MSMNTNRDGPTGTTPDALMGAAGSSSANGVDETTSGGVMLADVARHPRVRRHLGRSGKRLLVSDRPPVDCAQVRGRSRDERRYSPHPAALVHSGAIVHEANISSVNGEIPSRVVDVGGSTCETAYTRPADKRYSPFRADSARAPSGRAGTRIGHARSLIVPECRPRSGEPTIGGPLNTPLGSASIRALR